MSRETTFQFRVSTEERERIRQYAKQAGMKDSEYARSAVLHEKSLDEEIPDAAPTVGPDEPLPENRADASSSLDLEARAKQIYGERGIPMSQARRIARQEVEND